VSFRWDADSRADGVLSPKRLLINTRTPYSLTVGSTRNDQEAEDSDPGFPCCDRHKLSPPPRHTILFYELASGIRLPAAQRFSGGGDWWHWTHAPATINGFTGLSGEVVAFVPGAEDGIIGSVDFSTPVFTVDVTLDARAITGKFTLE